MFCHFLNLTFATSLGQWTIFPTCLSHIPPISPIFPHVTPPFPPFPRIFLFSPFCSGKLSGKLTCQVEQVVLVPEEGLGQDIMQGTGCFSCSSRSDWKTQAQGCP